MLQLLEYEKKESLRQIELRSPQKSKEKKQKNTSNRFYLIKTMIFEEYYSILKLISE